MSDYKEVDDNNNNDEYEKVCYICKRTESKAGKMISMPGNIYICPDCMQKTLDTINNSGVNYEDMMKNMNNMPNMGNFNGMLFGDFMDNMGMPNKQKVKKKKEKSEPS